MNKCIFNCHELNFSISIVNNTRENKKKQKRKKKREREKKKDKKRKGVINIDTKRMYSVRTVIHKDCKFNTKWSRGFLWNLTQNTTFPTSFYDQTL